MATLQSRNGSHRLLFQYAGRQFALPIGKVSDSEALAWKGRAELLLIRLKQHLLELPPGVDIVTFLQHDGHPPTPEQLVREKHTNLHNLREAYLKTHSNGAIESNTLYTARIHLNHVEQTLGKDFILSGLTLGKLQGHIDRRQTEVRAVTIKKELDTFRGVWNWGLRMGLVHGVFPGTGLVYPKGEEKLPFMTWEEIERRMKAGGNAEALWECLYLRPRQTAELLAHAKKSAADDWFHPMLTTAAHTGARRSELIRARCEDVDLDAMVLTIREKKRVKGTCTTRRVPISPLLAQTLRPLLDRQRNKTFLFGESAEPLTVSDAQRAWHRAFRDSNWKVVRGYHVLRHSFISALASCGIDQRIIDDCVGHSTEQQRKRYRHLFPKVTQDAIATVFGNLAERKSCSRMS